MCFYAALCYFAFDTWAPTEIGNTFSVQMLWDSNAVHICCALQQVLTVDIQLAARCASSLELFPHE